MIEKLNEFEDFTASATAAADQLRPRWLLRIVSDWSQRLGGINYWPMPAVAQAWKIYHNIHLEQYNTCYTHPALLDYSVVN